MDRKYPKTVETGGAAYVIRKLSEEDAEAIQDFAKSIPQQDLLYLNRDITVSAVINAWIKASSAGAFETLVAEKDGRIVATSALVVDKLSWSSHVGEIRILVASEARGKGLGRLLVEETFLLALESGLSKVTAQMTLDQKGAIAVFEELGFSGEALFKDHVRDSDGQFHDLLILSCDVSEATSRLQMAG